MNQRAKFQDPEWTAKGERRATVPLLGVETLWFNTGTRCNITCTHCYIESSPTNDRLAYLTRDDIARNLDGARERGWPVREVGFTGGEPFLNPAALDLLAEALGRGFDVLVLSNGMRPMQRPRIQQGLIALESRYPGRLTVRVSLDHHSAALHDAERGAGAFEQALAGLIWLREQGIRATVAGRTLWDEAEHDVRGAFSELFSTHGLPIDAHAPAELVLFPEMDEHAVVPEITTDCWGILGKHPDQIMCATSRMIVKRRGAAETTALACTLIAYDDRFALGSLEAAERPVSLNHPHCAKFCVLGGASCSA